MSDDGKITEWEFTAEVAGWIAVILDQDKTLPFSEAKCEQRGKGSEKRRDLTLIDKDGNNAITGEVKMPFTKDGGTPFNEDVIQDARKKAASAKVNYFFTWNVNEMVLWETFPPPTPRPKREYKSWKVAAVRNQDDLVSSSTEQTIKTWLHKFLIEAAQIYRGQSKIGIRSLDDKFIDQLESFLERPIQLIKEELHERYKGKFKAELDAWMRDEQGWFISDSPQSISDNLERAAHYTSYDLVIRKVFYEAMLKRYSGSLKPLDIPKHIDTGDRLLNHLAALFASARDITGNYETVFIEHHEFGNRIPFLSDSAVDHWRDLVQQIEHYDFSKLDYDIIGRIFERLISPEERHKYGQYYTRPEVVDLINSFCIRKAEAKVLDPACGGGTFLVRAYARKRNLDPARKHGKLLSEIYGIDIDAFAAHLTTINLATRDLIDEENYPQIARDDFFNVRKGSAFLSLPVHKREVKIKGKGLGKFQHRDVAIPVLDAIVGNPPYVRQEQISSYKMKNGECPRRGTKEYYSELIKEDWNGLKLSGRSDIHIYFWPHAASFLAVDGHFGFLTSSQWMDVEYGFELQKWILSNFEIAAILESIDEPWFVGARVTTTITILKRQPDVNKRMSNIVRFVQLRRPIAEILENDGTTPGQMQAVDAFRDEILFLESDAVNERYRARLISQSKLWEDGVRLGVILGKSKAIAPVENEDEADDAPAPLLGDYYGGKWGVYIRVLDFWFDLLNETEGKWSPLGEIASIWRGITSGKDIFFFPKDFSSEALEQEENASEFAARFRVRRSDVEKGKVKIVKSGEGYGEVHAIEAKYLEPEVHSLMEIDGFTVGPENCSRMMLLVGKKKGALKGTHVLEYIEWGEENAFHQGSTCGSRAGKDRTWYDLTGHNRGAFFWPMAQQYKHAIAANDCGLICNHNLFDITPHEVMPGVLGGILNSTFVVLSKHQFGRPVGVEGNLKTEVIDVNMMLIPDPRIAPKKTLDRIAKAFIEMKKRKALYFISERRLRRMSFTQNGKENQLEDIPDVCELDMPDRRELDEAVLEMLGVSSKKRREELIDALYAHLREFYEAVRQKEEKAIENKKRANRGAATKPSDIAQSILDEIRENEKYLLKPLSAFLPAKTQVDTYDLNQKGKPEYYSDMFRDNVVRFGTGKNKVEIETRNKAQVEAILSAWNHGTRGLFEMPLDEKVCGQFTKAFEEFATDRDKRIHELIAERTADEDVQAKVAALIMQNLWKDRL